MLFSILSTSVKRGKNQVIYDKHHDILKMKPSFHEFLFKKTVRSSRIGSWKKFINTYGKQDFACWWKSSSLSGGYSSLEQNTHAPVVVGDCGDSRMEGFLSGRAIWVIAHVAMRKPDTAGSGYTLNRKPICFLLPFVCSIYPRNIVFHDVL